MLPMTEHIEITFLATWANIRAVKLGKLSRISTSDISVSSIPLSDKLIEKSDESQIKPNHSKYCTGQLSMLIKIPLSNKEVFTKDEHSEASSIFFFNTSPSSK